MIQWANELDHHGCLGIGFGGGEPTLHPEFVELSRAIAHNTRLAVTFTTHAHRLTEELAAVLAGNVHFVRVSVDGLGKTYARLRGKPFAKLCEQLCLVRAIGRFGINVVVNEATSGELDALVDFALSEGAEELVLLPEQRTAVTMGVSPITLHALSSWVQQTAFPLRLAISSRGHIASIPTADPFPNETPLEAHAHIDAFGFLREDAFSTSRVPVGGSVIAAVANLRDRRASA